MAFPSLIFVVATATGKRRQLGEGCTPVIQHSLKPRQARCHLQGDKSLLVRNIVVVTGAYARQDQHTGMHDTCSGWLSDHEERGYKCESLLVGANDSRV